MTVLKNLSIQLKTNIIAILIILAITISSAKVLLNIRAEDDGLVGIGASADTVVSQMIPLTGLIAKVRLDVVEVQQFLSDISATRGQDGLADGLDNAAEYAKRFAEDIENAEKIATRLGLTSIGTAIEETRAAFKPFYEVGQKMAHAYVDGGPAAGNAMMPQFDKIADAMDEGLGKLEKETVAISKEKAEHLQGLIAEIQKESHHIEITTIISSAIMIAIAAALVVFLLFGVTKPLNRLREVMLSLANGELDTTVIYTDRHDEVGDMARAVAVLQQHGQDNERLKQAEAEETKAKVRRQQEQEELIDMFATSVSGVFDSLTHTTKSMAESAEVMHGAAVQTHREVDVVTGAVGETSANSQSVAAASQELSSAIGEIGRLINVSAQVAEAGTERAREVENKVSLLRAASEKIGDIIKIIGNIASQTNLLALNATIEAARAGEAGRGFAVVAGEVKNLSAQTQKATVDIASQVEEIQNSISGTIESVQAIGQTVAQIHQATSEIAAAVTEQHSATEEIARNVQYVSSSAEQITTSISLVRDSADRTNLSSSQVREASQAMSGQTEKLTVEVRDFLSAIKGAGTRHAFERLALDLPVQVTSAGRTFTGRARQISLGGIWLDVAIDTEIGKQVELSLTGVARPVTARVAGHTEQGSRLQFPLNDTHIAFVKDLMRELAGRHAA